MEACPFCGGDMQRGSVRLRGWYAVAVTAVFEPDDRADEATQVLGPSRIRRRRPRRASQCTRCDAVVLAPRAPTPDAGPAFPRYGEADPG